MALAISFTDQILRTGTIHTLPTQQLVNACGINFNRLNINGAVDPWVRKIPQRREQPPTPVLLLGESHGQRSLSGYSPQGNKESDMTEQLMLTLSHIRETRAIKFSFSLAQYYFFQKLCAKLLQSCSTLCEPVDCSQPGSSVPGISQARILEWVVSSLTHKLWVTSHLFIMKILSHALKCFVFVVFLNSENGEVFVQVMTQTSQFSLLQKKGGW